MSGRGASFALSGQVPELLNKMRDTDSDLRVMALMDVHKELSRQPAAVSNPPSLSASSSSRMRQEAVFIPDEHTEAGLCSEVLKLLNDPISEVKNVAVNCVAGLSRRPRPRTLKTITDQLLAGIAAQDEEQRDISCLALKSVVADMPREDPLVGPLFKNIVQKILEVLRQPDPNPQLASELLQILSDLYANYPRLAAQKEVQAESLDALISVLNTARISIRKRAVPALSALVSTDAQLFDSVIKAKITEGLAQGGGSAKIWVAVVANLARGQSVGQIGALVGEGKLVGAILAQSQNPEDTEAVEGALSALEVLVLRCPAEVSFEISTIVQRSLELVKYDPNYVELDEDEDDVDMNGDDDDDDYDDDEYSDDEDDSWKVRRSAAKLLQANFGTRNELLTNFYDVAAGTLISRFQEREESVRLEVLTAFEVLLKQTAVARNAELASGGRNKRKRSQDMDQDGSEDDSATARLHACSLQLLAAILKQLSSKSIPTRQQCFALLRQIAEVLQGGLDSSADAICGSAAQALRSIESTVSSSLAISALAFLATFFLTHGPRAFSTHIDTLASAISRCMKDKLHRISAEALAAASALAQTARPSGSASPLGKAFAGPIQSLFQTTTEVLADPSVDSDVRERALDTLGNLLVYEGDVLASSFPTALPLIKSRLASEATSSTAIHVIGRIADAPTCAGNVFDSWLLEILPDVLVAVRRSKRAASKNAEFVCLQHILTRIASSLPVDTANALIVELKAFIETPTALQVVALVLDQQPGCRPTVTAELLPTATALLQTPAISPHLVDSLVTFFSSYVAGDPKSATDLISQLIALVGQQGALPDATKGGTSVHTAISRCIGAIVVASPAQAASSTKLFQQTITSSNGSESSAYLALLSIGEIGRTFDLSKNTDVFQTALAYLKKDSEELRSAAAFALGNMAVGAPKAFLSTLIGQMQQAKSGASRVLFLHALKEVILHSPPAQLETIADQLWAPLLSKTGTDTSSTTDDSVRNVKAACIGKLTTTAPAKFLPQLQELLKSSPQDRAIVAAAVRYTFIDTSSSYDELIAPIIVDFLSLMHDEDVVVRRLSLASLNAALQNKPHLIIDRLGSLQTLLYKETEVRKELQREVVMGPWRVIEDDGLENRKTALETMHTLLGTCFSKVDLPVFLERVLAALEDHNEVKPLGLMLLLRLGQLAPTSVIPRLDDTVVSLQAIMKDVEVKEDTVKHDLERKTELQRSTLRTAVPLYKMSTQAQAPEFHSFVLKQLSIDKWKEFRDYRS